MTFKVTIWVVTHPADAFDAFIRSLTFCSKVFCARISGSGARFEAPAPGLVPLDRGRRPKADDGSGRALRQVQALKLDRLQARAFQRALTKLLFLFSLKRLQITFL